MHVVHTLGEMVGCPPVVGPVTGSGAPTVHISHTGGSSRVGVSKQ